MLSLNALTAAALVTGGCTGLLRPQPQRGGVLASHGTLAASPRLRPSRVSLMAAPEGLILTEENVQLVIDECQRELGTMFGVEAQSREVGITGGVELVDLDGPCIIVRFTGRFWHARRDVLERVERYVLDRIPEAVAVEIEDEAMLDDADPSPIPSRD